MPNEIVMQEPDNLPAALDPDVVLTRKAQILDIMRDVLIEGVHYDTIPGCKKPSLLQPGAETLNSTFRLGWRHEIVSETVTEDEISFEVRSVIFNQLDGTVLGDAIASASTSEDKWKWRSSFQAEWDDTPATHRRQKWFKGDERGPYQVMQVRTHPADLRNTVLAMAQKRADVRSTRAALAASDVFDVGADDLPEDIREEIFGDQSGEEDQAKRTHKQQRANRREQKARAGMSNKPTPPADPAVQKVSKEQVKAYMQAMAACGFTFKKDDGKTGFTDEGKAFLKSINAASFFPEMETGAGAKVIQALDAEATRRAAWKAAESARTTEAPVSGDADAEPPEDAPPPEITDPFAEE